MTKFLTRVLTTALLVCAAVGVASAKQWPNATYPDTLNIYAIQFGLANPAPNYPTSLDTVYGVGGIVTGFDAIPTGFAFYIQTTGGNPYTGIDIFTGSFNYKAAPYNLAIGDSVVISGGITEFGGGTEIQGFDNVQGTNDIIINKISSGNTVPPVHGGTTTQLHEVPKGNVSMEQWEGMLVSIAGPLTVARTSLTGGLGTNNSFLVVSASAPSDSVFIEGNTLTTYAPPSVGTPISNVQGIYDERPRGYRIQLRDGNDIIVNTPPNVTDAYPLTDTQIRVKFDRDVTSGTATNVNNYSLASFGSIDAATMDGATAVLLDITNGLPHGALESITTSGITGVAAGQTMTSPQTNFFINGVLTCAEVQAPNPDSLSGVPCLDKSRFAGGGGQTSQGNIGTRMSMEGVVTGIFTPLDYLGDEAGGSRSGVSIFAPPTAPILNHKFFVSGQVQEFFGESEVSAIADIRDKGAVTPLSATNVKVIEAGRDTCDYTNAFTDGEDVEGMLVKLQHVKVVQRFIPLPTNGFHVAGENPYYFVDRPAFIDTVFVMNLNSVLGASPTFPALGTVVSVTGNVHYTGNSFRVCPRNAGDIVTETALSVPMTPGKVSFTAFPNPGVASRLVFSLPVDASVSLGVYDVTGRLVTQLVKGHLPAGEYTKMWDGRTSAGKAGAGVYFYRLTVDGQTYSVRTVRLGR